MRTRFDPSKTFKVTKYFVEGGRKFEVGDIYEPRFKSSKRSFRHWVARRIDYADAEATQDVQHKEEVKVEGETQEETTQDIAQVIVDDGDDFQVIYKGVQFPIKRNQLREDGTLTNGGLKAFKEASE